MEAESRGKEIKFPKDRSRFLPRSFDQQVCHNFQQVRDSDDVLINNNTLHIAQIKEKPQNWGAS